MHWKTANENGLFFFKMKSIHKLIIMILVF